MAVSNVFEQSVKVDYYDRFKKICSENKATSELIARIEEMQTTFKSRQAFTVYPPPPLFFLSPLPYKLSSFPQSSTANIIRW